MSSKVDYAEWRMRLDELEGLPDIQALRFLSVCIARAIPYLTAGDIEFCLAGRKKHWQWEPKSPQEHAWVVGFTCISRAHAYNRAEEEMQFQADLLEMGQ